MRSLFQVRWCDTLNRRDAGPVHRKMNAPSPKADEGKAKAQPSSWHTSEGEKVKRASAWSRGNTRAPGTDSPPDRGSEVDALAYSMLLRPTC